MSSILRSSKFVRYFIGLARNIVTPNRQEVEGNLFQRSQHLASVFSSSFSSSPLNLQSGSALERTVRRLDEEARQTGRISVREIEGALNEIRHYKQATTSQSLMVIRCCGNLVPEETPEKRTKLVEEIWNTLENLGVNLDISHYNALLKVYLENEHKFSPTEFLTKLEKRGVEPNRVTYQRLIAGYCQLGDIAGATKILEFMKEKQLPVSEGVFNALVLGHSQADDMESAEGILKVMKQANLEPSNETYTALLSGFAKRGDKAAVDRLITDCKVKDVLLSDTDILELTYIAAINGHDELSGEILKNIRYMAGYNQDAANIILRLMTKGKDEAAYKVFLTMQAPAVREGTHNMSGHIIIKQLIKTNRSAEEILSMCDRLKNDGHTPYGLSIAVETSFYHGNVDLTLNLLRVLKEKGEPIRNHYFWPSLITAGKTGNIKRSLDILKTMVHEFNLSPAADTLRDYYFPYVGSRSTEQHLNDLLDTGVRRGQSVVSLVSYYVTQNRIKEALALALQNPGLNYKAVFSNRLLVEALQQTKDVKSVVSLVHILASNGEWPEQDEEFGQADESPSRFVVGVVTDSEAKNKLADVLNEMVNLGLSISNTSAELVESRLQGNQLTAEISQLLAKLSSGELSPITIKRTFSGAGAVPISRNPEALERIKEKIKANNEPQEKIISIVRSIFQAYCYAEDLENALKVMQEWKEDLKQEVPVGMWAQLLGLYCNKEDLEGAEECLRNVKTFSEDFELDTSKIMKMAKLYIQKNQFDEAVNLVKDIKTREEKGYMTKAFCWQALNAMAEFSKDPDQVKKLLNILLEKQLVDINNALLGPIIKAHLLRNDMEGALKEFEFCVKTYRATPWKNEITARLIEKEDPVNLQTVVDLSTQVHGEINSLYDLVLSFVECGRIRQARKILETPGLSTRNNRLQAACERYRNEGLAAPLEGLVEATKDFIHIDRSEIYYNLLDTYCQTNDVDKAVALWTQMQDEDVHISDEFLLKLGDFMRSKGLSVPFSIPEEVDFKKNVNTREKTQSSQQSINPLTQAINRKNAEEAFHLTKSQLSSGKLLSRGQITRVLELLMEKGKLEEATSLFTSFPRESLPVTRSIKYFLNRLAQQGEIDLIKKVGDCLSEELKRETSYTNRYMNCAVIAGNAKAELENLEKQIDDAKTQEEVDAVAYTFPLGGIHAILESSPDYHEQVISIVKKYYEKGVATPANCLCMFYMAQEQFEKAKEYYQSFNLNNSSRIMFQNVLAKARTKRNPRILEELISLLKDAPAITPETKGVLYSNLLNIYMFNNNFETALVKLEESLNSVPIDRLYTSTLAKLKEGLEAKNIPFNYTIPPKRANDSSSSSSSSDAEPKQSMAAKH